MQQQATSAEREIHGAMLEASTMNGYSVHHNGDYLGFIHAAGNGRWHTYLRVHSAPDESLGTMLGQDDAVCAILVAAGRESSEEISS